MHNLAYSAASRLGKRWRDMRTAASRTPPTVPFGRATGRPPRIFYLSPDPITASGGVRVIYRHVDLLNELGFPATVLHARRGYRADWFENDTRVSAARDAILTPDDILVVPELYGANLRRLQGGPRIVLFNQGFYHTFAGVPLEAAPLLAEAAVEAILTVSEDSLRALGEVFEGIPVHRARPVVDPSVFHPADRSSDRRRICFLTTRREVERHHVLSILRVRGRVQGWELVPIEGMAELEVAQTMRRSAIFLSFSSLEGFGLPPAEAMACGCYVIGFHGQGGQEYFDPAYCQPIPDADLLGFVHAVEAAVADHDADPRSLDRLGSRASAIVLERYSLAGLREDLLAFYASLGVEPRVGASARASSSAAE